MLAEVASNYIVFFLVFARISGLIAFNPLFSRRNVPMMVRAGLILMVTIIVSQNYLGTQVAIVNIAQFAVLVILEFSIGFVCGTILTLAMSSLLVAGEAMDMQMGIAMSKIYDPSSNVQMPVTGSIVNIMFLLIFFLSDGHLTSIKIITDSYALLPVGFQSINPQVGMYVATLFADILVLSLKLAMPVMAIEILAEACMGILMKAIPQINVFAVNLQIKLFIGLIVIFIIVSPLASMIETIINFALSSMVQAVRVLSS